MNPFVPKPGTPFQWLRMENVKDTDDKLQYLRKAFAKIPNVEAICKSARTGFPDHPGPGRPAGGRRSRVRGAERLDLKRATKALASTPRSTSTAKAQGRSPALGHHRQRSQPRLFLEGTDKSRQEALSPHCPEIQGCIRCGVCEDKPNPSYPLPEKWKALGTSPRYLKVAAEPAVPVPSEP